LRIAKSGIAWLRPAVQSLNCSNRAPNLKRQQQNVGDSA
jgi:hypothetical protein